MQVAESMEQWIFTINNELMASYLAKSAAIKVRSKLSLYEGRSVVVNFMKELMREILNSQQGAENLLNHVNALIAYTLGIVKHSMFTKELTGCMLLLIL